MLTYTCLELPLKCSHVDADIIRQMLSDFLVLVSCYLIRERLFDSCLF